MGDAGRYRSRVVKFRFRSKTLALCFACLFPLSPLHPFPLSSSAATRQASPADRIVKPYRVHLKGPAVVVDYGDTREGPFYPVDNLVHVLRQYPGAKTVRMVWTYWFTGDYSVTYDRRKRTLLFRDSGRGSLSDGPSIESHYRFAGVTEALLRKVSTLTPPETKGWVVVRPATKRYGETVDDKTHLPQFNLLIRLGCKRHRVPSAKP